MKSKGERIHEFVECQGSVLDRLEFCWKLLAIVVVVVVVASLGRCSHSAQLFIAVFKIGILKFVAISVRKHFSLWTTSCT
jgi:hypothetical protein